MTRQSPRYSTTSMIRATLRAALLLAALLLTIVPPVPTPASDGLRLQFGVAALADDGGDGGGSDGGSGDGGGDDGGGDDGGGGGGGSDGSGGAEPLPNAINRFFSGDAPSTEIVAARVTPAQLATLAERGYAVVERRSSALLPTLTVKLRVPARRTLEQAIEEVEQLNPASVADRNHYYRYAAAPCSGPQCEATTLVGWPQAPTACPQRARVTIGVIDTAIARDHPALADRAIEVVTLRSGDRRPSDPAHGTAVASLLVGAPGSSAPGLLRDARIVAVDAFYRAGLADERMDVFDLVTAIDELVRRKLRLINLSFAGPPNKLLERSVAAAARRGVVLVAAVGNDGARAEPRYPAAYPSVIAVTAVRPDTAIYRRAVQGEHVDLAAPGVDVWVAQAGGSGGRKQTGTSYAAPFVTAAAALVLARSPGISADALRTELQRKSRDLGAPGVDPVYGHGLLRAGALCGNGALRTATR